ncbi:MAG: helix-turn-helix transcriptional regulator [Clostridia bacterium]|nr:helix-turn-helix transcriptional regulator [Clostridia bacterium]
MDIGNTIRTKRRAKDMTQEELAEVLNLSVSAVSQWECGKNLPDITIIPALCAVLEITSDELLGMDSAHREEQITALVEESQRWGDRGYLEKQQEILEDGLKRFPDNWHIMHQLMHSLYFSWSNNHDDTQSLDKAIRYGERILEKSTDDSARQGAVQILCYAYDEKGEKDRAEKLAWSACGLFNCRDSLLVSILDGDGGMDHNRWFVKCMLDEITLYMPKNYTLDSGEKRFTDAEQVLVYEKIVQMYEIMFEDGDYGFYHDRLREIHTRLAEYYAARNDAENTIANLRITAYHAVKFVEFAANPDYTQTSLLFRGQNAYGFSATKTANTAADSLDALENTRYDFIRETPEFAEIRRTLETHAGEWQKRA